MKVALYLRVSSEEQAKHGSSLDAQLEKLESYCEMKDWDISETYIDEGVSAGSIGKRKDFTRMIEDSKNKKFDAVIVTKFDRAFRNVKDAITTLEDFSKDKIDFISLSENIDTTTPMGNAMFIIISTFAQLERQMNTSRVKDVRKHRFDSGMFPSRSPYGYRPIRKDGKVVGFKIYQPEGKVVLDVFKMASEGVKYTNICKKHKLKPQQYYNILRNKVYCGYIQFEGQEKKGIHDPIISEELFRKVNEK